MVVLGLVSMPAQHEENSDKPKFWMKTEVVEDKPEEVAAAPVDVEVKKETVSPSPEGIEKNEKPTAESSVGDLARLPLSTMQEIAQGGSRSRSGGMGAKTWMILAFVLGLGAGGLGLYLSRPVRPPQSPKLEVRVTDSENVSTVTPVPSKVEVDKSSVAIQVLNGTGIKGEAGKMGEYLVSLGYSEMVTGNASRSNYKETTVSVKLSKKEAGQLIASELEKKYTVSEELGVVEEKDKYDVIVILGQ